MKLTNHHHLVPRPRVMELYLHSPCIFMARDNCDLTNIVLQPPLGGHFVSGLFYPYKTERVGRIVSIPDSYSAGSMFRSRP
jgi:hypothetical protein